MQNFVVARVQVDFTVVDSVRELSYSSQLMLDTFRFLNIIVGCSAVE